MKISRVHHVAIICSNYERTRQFYISILGFTIAAENLQPHRGTYKLDLLTPGGTQIEVFHFASAPQRPSHPEALGLRHLAFEVGDLDAAWAHLDAHQVPMQQIRTDEYTGRRFFFVTDPDDLPIEFYEGRS